MSIMVEEISQSVIQFVKEFIMKTFDQKMKESLEDTINHALWRASYSRTLDVFGRTLEIDYAFTDQGIAISEDYISLIFDGTCHPADKHDDVQSRKYSEMPYF